MNGRTRFTDTFTLALALIVASTLLWGMNSDTFPHWLARITGSTLVAHVAVSWWRDRHQRR